MKQGLKDRWLSALRSGRYEQGKGYLHAGERYCCLGVLCDLLDTAGWHSTTMPTVKRWVNPLTGRNATTTAPIEDQLTASDQIVLMNMNDSGESSFAEIADWIEGHVKVTQ